MASAKKIAVQLRKSLMMRTLGKMSMERWQKEIERKWVINEEGDLPYVLREVNLGVAYAQQTGRLTGEAEAALKKLNLKQYTDLLGELAVGARTQSEVPRYLNKKYGASMFEKKKNDLPPEVEKKIDKIEADIKSGKISDKEGRKKIGDLMSAASKVKAEALIEAHLNGESVQEIIEKISGYDPRWGNPYPYVPTVRHNEPGFYDSDKYNYPQGSVGRPPRTSHETRVGDSHEAEADEFMLSGDKR